MVGIDDWVGGALDRVTLPPTQKQPTASVIPPVSTGTGGLPPGTGYGRTDGAEPPAKTTTTFDPRGGLPNPNTFTSKEDALWGESQAAVALDIWNTRLANARLALSQAGGSSGEEYDSSLVGYDPVTKQPTYNGQPTTQSAIDAMANGSGGSSKGPPELVNAVAEAQAAVTALNSYKSTSITLQGSLPKGGPSTYAGGGDGVDASGSTGGSGGSSTPAKPKPVPITVRQFMDAISQQESGGNYDITNPDSGAHGRFQIMPENWPSWSVEAGLPAGSAPTAANQDRVAEFKMQQYFNQYGNWADVASVWYSGRPISTMDPETANAPQGGGKYPSIKDYVASIMGKLPDAGGGVTGEMGDPLADFLKSGAYGLEKARAGETDRQYDNLSKRAKDVLGMMQAENALLDDVMQAKKASQAMSDDASATAANVNKMVGKGELDHYSEMAGPMWSDPLAQFIKQLKTAPEGFSDSYLHAIPKEVPLEYYLNDSLGMEMPSGERWAGGTVKRFAEGTISIHDEPYVALYKAGKAVPPAILARLQAAGVAGPAGQGATWTPNSPAPATPAEGSVIPPSGVTYPDGSTTTYQPGYVPKNATVPTPLRTYDTNDWLDHAVETMARNITAGNSALPASWGVSGLESWHGVPAAEMPASFMNQLRNIISTHRDTPEIIAAFGKDPGVATTYVKDPNAPPETTKKATPGTGGGGGGSGQGFSTGNSYSGTYGGGAQAAQGDPDLDKKLGWEREQFKWTKEYQQAQLDLARIQDTRSAEYQAAQIRQMEAAQALNLAQLELQKIGDARQEAIFQENLRAAQEQERVTGIKLDMDRVRMESDMRFQQEDLDLKKQAGALSQAEYEERKRQFDLDFSYRKEKDDKALNMERARIQAEVMSNPNNSVQQQFTYAGMADPVGKAYDLFSGEFRGNKTYTEAYNEDAKIYEEAMRPPRLAAGSGFIEDKFFITGDNPKGNRTTGFEEGIYNPTGAPLAVINNKLSQKIGVIPPKGHEFGDNIRKGVA